ncbi:MAG TPA: hypothetical protein VIL32_15790 [Steroidobacteraceae bacterium]
MSTSARFPGVTIAFAAVLLLFTLPATSEQTMITIPAAESFLQEMERAAAARDMDQWARYVAPDCEITVYIRPGGKLRAVRLSRSEYMEMVGNLKARARDGNVKRTRSTTPFDIRLEDGARRAVATVTVTEVVEYPGREPTKTVSNVTAHLEIRGGGLQAVRLSMISQE